MESGTRQSSRKRRSPESDTTRPGSEATATGAWPALGRVELRCHGKLTVANVPWLAGEEVYRPRWTAMELRCLRRVLNDSVHALRITLF